MSLSIAYRNSVPPVLATTACPSRVHELVDEQTGEVLDFLAGRPTQTVILAGLIHDNGLVSPLNRGTFFACRNSRGEIEGIALIGHATLFEARTEAALRALAQLAREFSSAHMILGEQDQVESFWQHYAEGGQAPRLFAREILLEQTAHVALHEQVEGLRPAVMDDLSLVVNVHAQMAYEESGVNPLETNPEAFRARCARRIERGRVWVWREGDRLIFKADVVAATPEAVYLEGVYVNPQERERGYAKRCLSQLTNTLLENVGSVSLLVNEANQSALGLYRRAGFRARGCYDTIFLRQADAA